jgi:AcrR family transcriptional regulator
MMDYRGRITEEAAVLFMKYGIRAVTMDSIANHLGMSKRTIYEHFADKDELLVSVINNMADKQKDVFRKIMDEADNVIEALFEMLRVASYHFNSTNPTYFMDLKKYHYRVYEMICQKGDIKNYEMSLEMLKRGVDEGIIRADVNIEIVNAGLHSVIDSIRDNEDLPQDKYSSFEIIDNLLFNFLIGISTPLGQELINKYKEQKKTELNA